MKDARTLSDSGIMLPTLAGHHRDSHSRGSRKHPASPRTTRRARWRALAVALATGASVAGLLAAELHEETVAAWERYAAATEQRIAAELEDGGERFLVLDFHEDAAKLRREVLAGDVVVEQLRTLDERGERFDVPKGNISHWMGAILVPNATLNDVLDGLQYDIPTHELQHDILESRVLARDGDTSDLYMRLRLDTPMASAQFNVEQTLEFVRPGGGRAWSRSVATRIAQIEDPGSPNERERPIGNDRGFIWRLQLHWRYQQVDSGVLVEVEQLTLSRSIPVLMRVFLGRFISRATRSSVTETLESIVTHLGSPAPADGG